MTRPFSVSRFCKHTTALLLLGASLVAAAAPPASYLRSGITAYQGRRWMEAMGCFLQTLSEDPKNKEAHQYLNEISRHIDEERVAFVNDARMDMLTHTAQRLDVAHLDTKPVDKAIDESKSKEAREEEEQRHSTCILAKQEEHLGHLENANDLVLGVLREDPNNAEAQRILSDLQSGIHESLNAAHDLTPAQQLALQGFYAYGQADYASALQSWNQVRTELAKTVPPDQLDHQLSLFHFDEYQKISQAHVDGENSKMREQGIFDEGVELFENGDAAGALERFRQIALNDPEYPQLAHYLSDSQDAVEKTRTQALSQDERNQAAQSFGEGLAFLDGDQPAEAKKAFVDVLRVDRSNARAKAYVALCQDLIERRTDASASQHFYESGLLAYAAGKPEDASREWKAAKQLDPGNLKAVIALAKVKKEIAQAEADGL